MLKTVFMIVGIVMIFEGIPYFTMPDKLKALMAQIMEMEDSNLRVMGFMMMIGGLGLLALSKI
ncbi:MAG: DUF2065 domain-containing protein [Nitrospinota bacterium]|nr:DUF2065 domain-containing protein [Nitrospinota bacterium]MDH5677053.1 DUF2065 domain-containing protein [Nitrospinota bacterium]MDH5755052.1 DUF2065 domain-containing protein [Nitrospinota bacterium]